MPSLKDSHSYRSSCRLQLKLLCSRYDTAACLASYEPRAFKAQAVRRDFDCFPFLRGSLIDYRRCWSVLVFTCWGSALSDSLQSFVIIKLYFNIYKSKGHRKLTVQTWIYFMNVIRLFQISKDWGKITSWFTKTLERLKYSKFKWNISNEFQYSLIHTPPTTYLCENWPS